jgi:DNA-directed RNA polymerase alpha subunit
MDKIRQEYITAKNVIKVCEGSKVSLDTSIRDLDISVRLANIMKSNDVWQIRDLLGMTVQDYLGARNLGIKTMREIRELYEYLDIELIELSLGL